MYSRKNKTYEEIFGIEKAREMKLHQSLASKGKPKSLKHKKRLSEVKIGKTYEKIYGKEIAKRLKNIRRNARIGYKLSEETKRKIVNTRINNGSYILSEGQKERLRLMHKLKYLGITFFTHQYMKEIEHSYHCDILIPSMKLVIETDGNYWHKYPIGREIDYIRTKELIEKGFKVLRLWESDIKILNINSFNNLLMNKCGGG